MKVLNLTEHKDGSATLELELTEEEIKLLVEYAIQQLIKKYLKETIDDINGKCGEKCNGKCI